MDYFDLAYDQKERIGFVFEDQMKILTGTFTHFCKTYFLCKSEQGSRAVCCDYSRKVYRTGCAIIVYARTQRPNVVALTSTSLFRVVPWIFGRQTYDMFKGVHETFPVWKHDFIVRRNHQTLKTYEITPMGSGLWQASSPQVKEGILQQARPIIETMKDYIGADLNPDEIKELIRQDQQDREMREDQMIRPNTGRPGRANPLQIRPRIDPITGTPM